MACTVGNKCAKNLCKQTVLLQLIVENVVTCFFWNTVYILQATTIVPATAAADNKSSFSILITIFYVFSIINSVVNKYVIVRHAQPTALWLATTPFDVAKKLTCQFLGRSRIAVESKSNRSCEQRLDYDFVLAASWMIWIFLLKKCVIFLFSYPTSSACLPLQNDVFRL